MRDHRPGRNAPAGSLHEGKPLVPPRDEGLSPLCEVRELVWVGGCVTTPATWASPPGRRRRSVHRSAKMASRGRFGALVYTVATRVAIRIATRAALGSTSASAATACWRRPLAGLSRLVGKTDSERVAPLLGWHLHRGVNPPEPLKSPFCSMPQTQGWRYRWPIRSRRGRENARSKA